MTGYRLAIVLSFALWALVGLAVHLLRTNPTFTLTVLACGLAVGMYAFKYRREL